MSYLRKLIVPWESLKALTIPVVLVVIVLVGLGTARSCFQSSSTNAAAVAAIAQGRVQAAERDLTQALKDRDQATLARKAVETENVTLRARLASHPMPKPRPTPPPDDQAVELVAAGIKTPLPPEEALKVWTWKAQAEELAPVKARLSAAEDLLAGESRENQALRVELQKSTDALVKMAQAKADLQDQVRALQAQASAQVRAEKLGTGEKVLELAMVAVVSYAGGRASK